MKDKIEILKRYRKDLKDHLVLKVEDYFHIFYQLHLILEINSLPQFDFELDSLFLLSPFLVAFDSLFLQLA